MTDVIHIPDLFGYIVSQISAVLNAGNDDPFPVYFDYGTKTDVNRKLIEKQLGKTNADKRYPLVWLLVPFDEFHDESNGYYCHLPDTNLFLVMDSYADKTAQERKLLTFVPRLYPIYLELINQLQDSSYFDAGYLKHKKTDFPYYDGRDGTKANVFPDFTDVVQVNVKNLFVTETVCDRFALIGNQSV